MLRLPVALRLARHRGRVRAGRGARLGRGVRFTVGPDAEVRLGDGCALGARTRVVAYGARVEIGPDAVLGERCTLVAHAGIAIGARAHLAEGTAVLDFDHVIADVERPIREQGLEAAPVRIGEDARIGLEAKLLRGVSVGAGATVGAHAVVTADVPAGVEVGGVPARPVAPA
jgi:acetyltransferase-like isoleucine patch superfamily enzyme